MMQSFHKKIIASTIALSFIVIAFFGVHSAMKIGMDGKMQNCPLLGQSQNTCPMTVAQHIFQWQQLLLATFQPNILSRLLLFFIAAAFTFVVFKSLSIPSFPRKRPLPIQSNYLLKALSEGILRKRE